MRRNEVWRECGCGERFGRVPCVDGLGYVKRCGGRQASFTDVYPSQRRVSSRRREENGGKKKKKSETKRNEKMGERRRCARVLFLWDALASSTGSVSFFFPPPFFLGAMVGYATAVG